MTRRLSLWIAIGVLLAGLAACDSAGGDGGGAGDVAAGDDAASGGSDGATADDAAVVGDAAGAGDDVAAPGGDVAVSGDDTTTADVPVDTGAPPSDPPTVTLTLPAYTAIDADFVFDVAWTGADVTAHLVIDGATAGAIDPATFTSPTRTVEPGVHDVAVRVVDGEGRTAETDPVPAILAGPGTFLPFDDAWEESGEIPGWETFTREVPAGADEVYDEKAHVLMPAGMTAARAWAQWTCDTAWDFGLDIGTGGCPHSGQLHAAADLASAEGPLDVAYEAPDGEELATGTWFAHVRFSDGLDHEGESVCMHVLFLALP